MRRLRDIIREDERGITVLQEDGKPLAFIPWTHEDMVQEVFNICDEFMGVSPKPAAGEQPKSDEERCA